jgi:hypothetical protein
MLIYICDMGRDVHVGAEDYSLLISSIIFDALKQQVAENVPHISPIFLILAVFNFHIAKITALPVDCAPMN